MKFQNVALHSWNFREPQYRLSSDEIEAQLASTYERLKLPYGRLELQTGIKERGYWAKGERPSRIASEAAKTLLMNFDTQQIDLLVHASVCRDFLEPATASVVHHNLALPSKCMLYDLSNACLGVVSATLMAASLIEAGQIRAALIVSGENSGPLLLNTIDFLKRDLSLTRQTIKKYIASLTIGSAATAWLVTHKDLAPRAPLIRGGVTRTDSSAVELCQGSGTLEELVMETDSEALMQAGLKLARVTFEDYLQIFPRPNKVIAHQVGSTHRRGFLEALDLSEVPDFVTYPTFGNTGSAALPLTFMLAHAAGFFASGDQVALTGIGSGLTSSMLSLEMP